MSKINFDALQGTKADQGAQRATFRLKLKIFSIFVAFIIGSIIFFAFAASLPGLLVLVVFVLFFGWMVVKSQKTAKTTSLLLQQLAAGNSWQESVVMPDDVVQTLSPLSIQSKKASATAVSGVLNGVTFWLSISTKTGTSVTLDAKKQLPTALLINPVVDLGETRIQSMRVLADGAEFEKISLEGDFDKYFHLYAKKSEIDEILSIVAPDFMMSLIKEGRIGSMSLQGHYCYLEASFDKASIRGVLEAADAVSKQLA